MTVPIPTLRETYGRWTFSYFVEEARYRGGPFNASADIHEGEKLRARLMLSWSNKHLAMLQTLREYCEEWAKDRDDPERVVRRTQRTIGDRTKAGQAGEKGVLS